MLATYHDFLARVEELGFMALSTIKPGFPSLSAETLQNQWHTGLVTDPWRWKDLAAQEKQLAYGCILGGHKGFVSAKMYPVFYAAYHPLEQMPERWAAGYVSQTTWQLWKLFEEKSSLNTSMLRKYLGVPRHKGESQVDSSIRELQRFYYITVSGNEQKVSVDGHLYGWASNIYTRVIDWAPATWTNSIKNWHSDEARELILDEAIRLSQGLSRRELHQVFKF
jgi:hypothetical protein